MVEKKSVKVAAASTVKTAEKKTPRKVAKVEKKAAPEDAAKPVKVKTKRAKRPFARCVLRLYFTCVL